MFNPKTEKIKEILEKKSAIAEGLDSLLADKKTNVYIDFANVLGWQNKLRWRIHTKRMKQFFDSFDMINEVKFYYGRLDDDIHSKMVLTEAKKAKCIVSEKPVKKIKISIDVSSIPLNSPALLADFIKGSLLSKLDLQTIELLNNKLKELNERGIYFIEDRKCNFDVEIGVDMLLDCDKDDIENFILLSGDSDFCYSVSRLLEKGKKVIIFSTSRRISTELSDTEAEIFDIKKIKEFICWPRDL